MSDDEYDFDPWETSSGLPDEITVKVTNPHFGYDAQLQDGKACAFFLEGQIVEGDGSGSEFSQWYTVGRGFEPASKGARLAPEDGKRRKLNNQTNYALLFRSLREAAEKQGLMEEVRKRGNPFETELWQGLELYMEREEYTRTINGEQTEGSRLNVVEIRKIGGRSGATAPTPAAPVADSDGDLGPKMRAELKRLASKVKGDGGSHSQFAEQAFSDVNGVLDNAAAEEAVMATGDGSIWAEA
jgi:hypothetical protein